VCGVWCIGECECVRVWCEGDCECVGCGVGECECVGCGVWLSVSVWGCDVWVYGGVGWWVGGWIATCLKLMQQSMAISCI